MQLYYHNYIHTMYVYIMYQKKKHMKREGNGLKRKNLNKDVKNLKPQKNQHKKLTLILKSFLSYFQKQVYTIVFFLEG